MEYYPSYIDVDMNIIYKDLNQAIYMMQSRTEYLRKNSREWEVVGGMDQNRIKRL
jgi:hypothetical protein